MSVSGFTLLRISVRLAKKRSLKEGYKTLTTPGDSLKRYKNVTTDCVTLCCNTAKVPF